MRISRPAFAMLGMLGLLASSCSQPRPMQGSPSNYAWFPDGVAGGRWLPIEGSDGEYYETDGSQDETAPLYLDEYVGDYYGDTYSDGYFSYHYSYWDPFWSPWWDPWWGSSYYGYGSWPWWYWYHGGHWVYQIDDGEGGGDDGSGSDGGGGEPPYPQPAQANSVDRLADRGDLPIDEDNVAYFNSNSQGAGQGNSRSENNSKFDSEYGGRVYNAYTRSAPTASQRARQPGGPFGRPTASERARQPLSWRSNTTTYGIRGTAEKHPSPPRPTKTLNRWDSSRSSQKAVQPTSSVRPSKQARPSASGSRSRPSKSSSRPSGGSRSRPK